MFATATAHRKLTGPPMGEVHILLEDVWNLPHNICHFSSKKKKERKKPVILSNCSASSECRYILLLPIGQQHVILRWEPGNNIFTNLNYECHQSSSLAIEVLKGSVKICQGNYRNALPSWCLWIRFAIMMTNSVWWMHPHCWECCGGGWFWQTSTSGFWSIKQ